MLSYDRKACDKWRRVPLFVSGVLACPALSVAWEMPASFKGLEIFSSSEHYFRKIS